MTKLLTGLESETKWIMSHPEYYHGPDHQHWVICQIKARYKLQAVGSVNPPHQRLFRLQNGAMSEPVTLVHQSEGSVELMDLLGWDCGNQPSVCLLVGDDVDQYRSTVAKRFVGHWFPADVMEDLYGSGYCLHEVITGPIEDFPMDAMGQVAVPHDCLVALKPLSLDEAMVLAEEEAPYDIGHVRYSLEHSYAFPDTPDGFKLDPENSTWAVESCHLFGNYTTQEMRQYLFDRPRVNTHD